MKNKNLKILIGVAFLLIVYGAYKLKGYSIDKQLIENHEITTAKITYFGHSAGSAHAPPEYTFYVNNRKFNGVFSLKLFCEKPGNDSQNEIRKLNIPVIYKKADPSINRILLKKEDFIKFNVPYPDSLEADLKRFFDCD